MKFYAFAGLCTLLLSSGPTHSGEQLQSLKTAEAQAQSGAYDLAAEEGTEHSRIARELAPLKSARDVHSYVESIPKHLSPLEQFSPSAKQQFLESLEFNESGLTTFDYTVLESLSPSQVYKVLSLFGLQSGTHLIDAEGSSVMDSRLSAPSVVPPDFLEGYRCEGPGTCASSTRHACTSNC